MHITQEDKNNILLWIQLNYVGNNINAQLLRDGIIDKFGKLPKQIDHPSPVQNNIQHNNIHHFLIETIGHIEYSPKYLYLLIHEGHFYFKILFLLSLIGSIASFFIFQYQIRIELLEFYQYKSLFFFIMFAIIAYISHKYTENLLRYMIRNIKAGDLLKVLSSNDETITEIANVPNPGNILNIQKTITLEISKKRKLCETIITYYKTNSLYGMYNSFVVFIAIDHLVNTLSDGEYRNSLISYGIEILNELYTFKRNELLIIYYLGFYYLLLDDLYNSLKYFSEYLAHDNNDFNVLSYVYYLEFIAQFSN